jgi:hypothetical protein
LSQADLADNSTRSYVSHISFSRINLLPSSSKCRRPAAIQERVTAVLLSIRKEAFADSFQKLYERCQPCVVKDDDYFEGQ